MVVYFMEVIKVAKIEVIVGKKAFHVNSGKVAHHIQQAIDKEGLAREFHIKKAAKLAQRRKSASSEQFAEKLRIACKALAAN